MTSPRQTRCAIYTRKSTEEGLDQAFNSLHAQREACEAYVKSQTSEGWRVLPAAYDDRGYSGGTIERPALTRLLADIDAGLVDTIVVYKIDRLTRSLADFAKIVERLDANGASFVSVTQAFNTTTSMGRLTLNVLLSFAQFEREVTGERIRDKIAASKAKGMWMGGNLPLGYDAPTDPSTRALAVNQAEADLVRLIFGRYLECGSVAALEAWLDCQGLRSKSWKAATGRQMGGARFSRGAIFHLLRNRVYLGEICHKGRTYPGAHSAIVDEPLFEAVQKRLEQNRQVRRIRPTRCATMPLKGLLFDADGEAMSPAFSYGRGGKLYRYYVSSPLQKGRRPSTQSALRRIAAQPFEAMVRERLTEVLGVDPETALSNLLQTVRRIEVDDDQLHLAFDLARISRRVASCLERSQADPSRGMISIPLRYCRRGGRAVVLPAAGQRPTQRTKDLGMIRALQEGHRIVQHLGWRARDGGFDNLTARAPPHTYARKQCRFAMLAPDIQHAIVEGRQPPELTLERLLHGEIPLDWDEQRAALGF